jgi:hypothetical protein
VPERRGFLLCENDYLPRSAREAGEGPVEAPARALPCGSTLVAFDELVDSLMAQAEALRDLAQRSAFGMESPDRVAVVCSGALELVLGLEHAVTGLAGLAERVRI